jgi:hypothetical protein
VPPVAEGGASGGAQRLGVGQRRAVQVAPAALPRAVQRQVVGGGLEARQLGLHGQLLVVAARHPQGAAQGCAAAGVLRQRLCRLEHVAGAGDASRGVSVAEEGAVGHGHACGRGGGGGGHASVCVCSLGRCAAAHEAARSALGWRAAPRAPASPGLVAAPRSTAARAAARRGALTCWWSRRRGRELHNAVDLVEPLLDRPVLCGGKDPVVPQHRCAVPVGELQAVWRAGLPGLEAVVDGVRDWECRRNPASAR